MSKREKRLQKIQQNPKNVAFDDLKQVLADYGITLDRIAGSHHIFAYSLGEQQKTLTIPFRRRVKPIYVKKALQVIEQITEGKPDDDSDE